MVSALPIQAATYLSDQDKHPSVQLSQDRLSVLFRETQVRAVRSDVAVSPGDGVFYFEYTQFAREGERGFGVATDRARLDRGGGLDAVSFAVRSDGTVWYRGDAIGEFKLAGDTLGLALDYRGAVPTVHILAGSARDLEIRTFALHGLSQPLYILVFGNEGGLGVSQSAGWHQRINPGNAEDPPFAIDASSELRRVGLLDVKTAALPWADAALGDDGSDGSDAGDGSDGGDGGDAGTAPRLEMVDPPAAGRSGEAVTFYGSAEDAEDGDLSHRIQWSAGPGHASRVGSQYRFVPAAEGVYPITARVTDNDGNESSVQHRFVVSDGDREPTIRFVDPPLQVILGEPLRLEARAEDAEDGDLSHLIQWHSDAGSGTGAVFEVVPVKAGSFSVVAGVRDRSGNTATARLTLNIVVENSPPELEWVQTPESVASGETAVFLARAEDAEDGDLSGHISWRVGNQRGVGPRFDFLGRVPGRYAIVATVADEDGAEVESRVEIEVVLGNQAPRVSLIEAPDQVFVGALLRLAAQAEDAEDGNLDDEIRWYDANDDLAAEGSVLETRIAEQGRARFTARIADSDGAANEVTHEVTVVLPESKPTVEILSVSSSIELGQQVVAVARATAGDGSDISERIRWSTNASDEIGEGPEFRFFPLEEGDFELVAAVQGTNREEITDRASFHVRGEPVDTDEDGLTDDEEEVLGTDPNDPDSDDDDLLDGVEVNETLTDPLDPDSDDDGMPDGWEVIHALNPNVDDAAGDPDLDGFSNLEEFTADTDPRDGLDYPGAPPITRLSLTDRHETVELSEDRLGVRFTGADHKGVRSDRAVAPGSGFFYYEGHREVPVGNYGFGVATAAAPLDTFGGAANLSLGVNTMGGVAYDGSFVSFFQGGQEYYGLAVDYRGANPVVHIIVSETLEGPGQLVFSQTMEAVTEPLYILVYGNPVSSDFQQTINPGNDVATAPFQYDPVAILTAAAVDGADQLNLGWNPPDPNANQRPVLNVDQEDGAVVELGNAVSFTATATDAEDGDVSADIQWSVAPGTATGNGSSFNFTPIEVGDYLVTATVSDSEGASATDTVSFSVTDPGDVDTDEDGLTDNQEGQLGTDPNDPDSDDDGLSDGDEVNHYGTDPLSVDSDQDTMPDGYEVTHGLNPTMDDGGGDLDGDTFTNLQEFNAGTNPNNPNSFPGASYTTLLSDTDKDPSITLTEDRLGAIFSGSGHRGVRSDTGLQPGSGFYYFEGRREVDIGNFGFGVASTSAPLDNYGGATDQALGVNLLGGVAYNGEFVHFFSTNAVYYGIAVDYRGASPVVYIIFAPDENASPELVTQVALPEIGTPLHILVYGEATTSGVQQTINPGNNLNAQPFHYDPISVLTQAGVAGAESLILGWNEPDPDADQRPILEIDPAPANLLVGTPLTLTATATDLEDGDLTAVIQWSDSFGEADGTGGTFTFTPTIAGAHTISATVVDSVGLSAGAAVTVNVVDNDATDSDGDGLSDARELANGTDLLDPDSDDDSLLDGAEVDTHLTNPLNEDTDFDLIPDGFEVNNGLDPLRDDADEDLDDDGFSNLEEYEAGTDPRSANSYPGAPDVTLLSDSDRDPTVTLTPDRLGVIFTGSGHRGVRSDTAIQPGSGFYYYEGRRLVEAGNFGFGVATADAPLDNFGGATDQSVGINTLGGLAYDGAFLRFFSAQPEYYGLAVDYRGLNPVVHVVLSETPGEPGFVLESLTMTQVTSPLYILVYGNALTEGTTQQTINPGNDVGVMPFHYNIDQILHDAEVPGADDLILGWNAPDPNANRRPSIVFSRTPALVIAGQTIEAEASATDSEDGDLTATIQWRTDGAADTGTGAVFSYTATAVGVHTITARVVDSEGLAAAATFGVTVVDGAGDGDNDGLTDGEEALAGTDPDDPDSDDDGLTDGEEVLVHGTNPLSADTDGDTMPDAYEVAHGLDPLVDDADGDLDGDNFTNLSEFLAGTDPRSANSFPGASGITLLSEVDKHPSVVLSEDRLGVRYTAPFHNGVRSDTAIQPGSGFYYFEGHREIDAGNYGFGVATAAAPLDNWGGFSDQSVGVNAMGGVAYDGGFVSFFGGDQAYYGFAVDYRGAFPVVHVILGNTLDGPGELIHSVAMTQVSEPLFIHVYGEPISDGIQQTVNPGNDTQVTPFHYDPVQVLTAAGVEGAETLTLGWNLPQDEGAGFETFLNEDDKDPTIVLTEDLLGATFTGAGHRGVRSDRAVEPGAGFFYYEGRREVDFGNYGFGVATLDAPLDNYGGATDQSLGANLLGGIAYEGEFKSFFSAGSETFGFAVDYRGVNPVVHIIGADFEGEPGYLIDSLTLTGIDQALYILVYGNPVAEGIQQTINPGNDPDEQPFVYDPIAILSAAAVPGAEELVVGWQYPDPNANRRPRIQLLSSDATVIAGTAIDLQATADDREDGDLTASLVWHDDLDDVGAQGGTFGYSPVAVGQHTVTVSVTDSGGEAASASLTLNVVSNNTPPTLDIDQADLSVVQGTSVTLTASAQDAEDGDLGSAIQWSDANGPDTAVGASFTFVPQAIGAHTITAEVTDGNGDNAADQVVVTVIDPATVDSDDDGLNDAAEAQNGTDPNDPDSDDDGLSDGDEVLTHGTDPLSDDSDNDGMPDGWELTHNLNPNVDDSLLDPDNDTFTNLEEYEAGTDPNSDNSFPGAPTLTYLSETDRHESVILSDDLLGARFTDGDHRGVRSNVGVFPRAGIYYYEGRRLIDEGDFGFGVATAAAPLDAFGGASNQSVGVHALGGVAYEGGFVSFFSGEQEYYGLAVDYRGVNPIVHVIASETLDGPGTVVSSLTMEAVSGPVFILVYGRPMIEDIQQTINPGNDTVGRPFRYDPVAVLTAAGVEGAADMVLGWQDPDPNANRPPVVVIDTEGGNVDIGDRIEATASAIDFEDGDMTAAIQWSDSASATTAVGGIISFEPQTLGDHVLTARVVDSEGAAGEAQVTFTVVDPSLIDTDNDGLSDGEEATHGTDPNDPDSDDDGLTDGAEVNTHGTDPLSADSDGDQMPDNYELTYGLDPTVDDGAGDLDNDTFSNFTEYQAGTLPNDPTSFPGAVTVTRLNPDDAAPGVQLTVDRLGVTFTQGNVSAVRSDVAVEPGSGVFYYEGHTDLGRANLGFGVATAQASLTSNGGADDQSIGVLAIGGITYAGEFIEFFSGEHTTYGLAVDYRGVHPIVHVILADGIGQPGEHFTRIEMENVTDSLYIFVYGQPLTSGVQQTINPGNDLDAHPFEFDIARILTDVWIGGNVIDDPDEMVLGWNRPNPRPTLAIQGGNQSVIEGATVTLHGTASDFEGTDISDDIEWDESGGNAGLGAMFQFLPVGPGTHEVVAEVVDRFGGTANAMVDVVVVDAGDSRDSDDDGLTDVAELQTHGTDPHRADSDGDGLSDGDEVVIHLTAPLLADTDSDGMDDAYEVRHGLNPLANDAGLDPDNDGYTNLAEAQADTDPNDAQSYPGKGTVLLSTSDKHPSVTLGADRLRVRFGDASPRAVRSEIAVSPGSGWSYFEGRRLAGLGNYGFAVATRQAPLDAEGGSDDQSVAWVTTGSFRYDGGEVGHFRDSTIVTPAQNQVYSLAVDYTGLNPVVYGFVGNENLEWEIMPAVTMSSVTGPVYIMVWGASVTSGDQAAINGGDTQLGYRNFHHPGHYVLFTEAFQAGAEFMGTGWGSEHAYAGRERPLSFERVFMQQDHTTGAGIFVSPGGLTISYSVDHKEAIRTNQGMIGEFRYWEAHRETEIPGNLGQGFVSEYGKINDYCCVSDSYTDTPPSMSINSAAGVWRNLVAQQIYDTNNTVYGFACDYRGSRPIIYSIVGGELINVMVLDDMFTPIHPMLYGNPQGAIPANSANFGTAPFVFDAHTILENAGVDVGDLVLGWGPHRIERADPKREANR
ncbi:PKD domain-containing protein [Sulfidibacter corallicola]|uniref:Uncharacterized protein n=1 Tax=Sulfidibacter corallicola TaxID=2818388 RepID=A0A8A4TPS1_SULCO|nr:hypothetical protein [Sulfidibacter corallicola]QTD51194.1 hypothetical protein J3U87_01885 [Sulfidibacter corallicola]